MHIDDIDSLFEVQNKPIADFLLKNSKTIIDNLPRPPNDKLISKKANYKKKDELQNDLSTYSVEIEEIKQAIKNADLEEGLYLFGEEETDLEIYNHSPHDIAVANGQFLQIICQAKSFPRPNFKLNLRGQTLELEIRFNKIDCSYQCIYQKEPAKKIDSGVYVLTITQNRRNKTPIQKTIEFNVQVGEDFKTREFHIEITPTKVRVIPGGGLHLEAVVNSDDPTQFEYKWFFQNRVDFEEKEVSKSSSERKFFSVPTEEGSYRCLVRHKYNGFEKFSERADVKFTQVSDYDLKIMLLMGNADYMKIECPSGECDEKFKLINSMDIYSNFSKIKAEMEAIGFLTISFINLNSIEYKAALNMLKKLCEPAPNVLLLVYVAGHGHNNLGNDFMIPINSQMSFHLNGHRGFLKDEDCSLETLMRTFEEWTEQPDGRVLPKFTVGVLWDLCRSFVRLNANLRIHNRAYNFPHTILYSCNAGKQGFYLNHHHSEFRDIDLERGTIFSNLFLRNFNSSLELHQVGEKMNQDMEFLKNYEIFRDLDRIVIESSPVKMKLKLKAIISKENEMKIKEMYIENSPKKVEEYGPNGKKLTYWFEPDEFVNTILLKVVLESNDKITTKHDPRLDVKIIDESITRKQYRIFNILRCDNDMESFKLSIECIEKTHSSEKKLTMEIELDFKHVWDHFQMLKNFMDWETIDYPARTSLSTRFDQDELIARRTNIDSEYSVSSTSLNSSSERAGEDDYESSSIVSADD